MIHKKRPNKPVEKKNTPALSFLVEQPAELMVFLQEKMPKKSRNNIKMLLREKLVAVDGESISQYNHPLQAGQSVEIRREKLVQDVKLSGVRIIYEDAYVLVIEKEAGLLSIATEKQKLNTAYSVLSGYVKQQDPTNRIFVVHRLDKDTSGIMLYAKSQQIQRALQKNWNDTILERTYVAVIEGQPQQAEGSVRSYLAESKTLMVYSTKNRDIGQLAITHYETRKSNGTYSLVSLNLETGRKNQIRVHMQDIGHPIVGDQKYGAQTDPIKRLGLHALVLGFEHPVSGQEMFFETEIPRVFLNLF